MSVSEAGTETARVTRRAVLRLGVPVIIANLVNVFLPFVVLALMGRMSDEAIYLRSLFLPMSQIFVALLIAVEMSNQVVVAIARGSGRDREVLSNTVNMMRLAGVGGAVLVALMMLSAPLFAELLGVEPHAYEEFLSFARWTSLALFLQVGPAVCASTLRGVGRTQAAMVVVATLAALEAGGVLVIGLGAGMGPMSLPVSIAVASATALVVGLALLRREGMTPASWRLPLSAEPVRWLGRVGVPVAGTHLLLSGFTLAQMTIIGSYGPLVVAGFAAASTFQGVLLQPAIALGTATAILLNQQLGAGRKDQYARTLRLGVETSAVIYALLAVAVWSGGGLIGAFASSTPEIAAETARFFAIVGLSYLFMGVLLTLFTIMEQIGMGFLALALNIVFFAAIIVVGWYASGELADPAGLYWTFSVGNVTGSLCLTVVVPLMMRRLKSRTATASSQTPVPEAPPAAAD